MYAWVCLLSSLILVLIFRFLWFVFPDNYCDSCCSERAAASTLQMRLHDEESFLFFVERSWARDFLEETSAGHVSTVGRHVVKNKNCVNRRLQLQVVDLCIDHRIIENRYICARNLAETYV